MVLTVQGECDEGESRSTHGAVMLVSAEGEY